MEKYELEIVSARKLSNMNPDVILDPNPEYKYSIVVKLPEQVLKIYIQPDYKNNPKVYISL